MNHNAIISTTDAALQSAPVSKEIFDSWLNSLDVSEKTRATYQRNIKPFYEYMLANGINRPIKEDVIRYRDALSAAGKKPATVYAYLIALKVFFHWTAENGLYPDISANVKSPKITTAHRKDPLTATQAAAVLKEIDRTTAQGARNYAIILLMVTTGLRTVEVIRANVEDVQQVSDGRHSFTALFIQGKGHTDKDEYIKLSEPVNKAIVDYLAKRPHDFTMDSPLFATLSNRNQGGRMTTRSLSRICKGAFINAGIVSNRITAHSLRHTAATINLLNGGTPEETQQLLRHQNPATTQIYSHALERGDNVSENRITDVILSAMEDE